jgi:hypothetical protein
MTIQPSSTPAQMPVAADLARSARTGRSNVSQNYLLSVRAFIATHSSYDDFVSSYIDAEEAHAKDTSAGKPTTQVLWRKYKAANYHLLQLRTAIIKVVWSHQIYLSVEVVDRLLFDIISDITKIDPIAEFFDFVINKGLHQPGFVLYPLHSFGIQGFGIFDIYKDKRKPYIEIKKAGLMITAQTNSKDKTVEFLYNVRKSFKIKQKLPRNFAMHLHNSVTDWLTRNPLLALRINSLSTGYYQNQFIIITKLHAAKSLLLMLSVFYGDDRSDPDLRNLSTARTNNFQTLNINHYIVFEMIVGGRELEDLRTPMNLSRAEMANLCDLNVDINPLEWVQPDKKAVYKKVLKAISTFEGFYLSEWLLGDREATRPRVLRKIHLSLSYFQRSFRSNQHEDEAVVSLAVAFETLLTDGYLGGGGVKQRVARRVGICTRGRKDATELKREVERLMERRGETVHQGFSGITLNLRLARQAYVLCFIKVLEKFPTLTNGIGEPLRILLGDNPPPPPPPCPTCGAPVSRRRSASSNSSP